MSVDVQGDSSGVADWTGTVSVNLTGNCGGALSNPCCTSTQTDPSGLLAQILNAVQALGTPLQGYGHFLVGPVTTGLQGVGTLAVTGSVAVRIDVTTIPSSLGREGSLPQAVFGMGWITSETPQGAVKSERLLYSRQVFYLHPAAQTIGYDLHPGVVISITQLDGAP